VFFLISLALGIFQILKIKRNEFFGGAIVADTGVVMYSATFISNANELPN
jgi:hypothetical protein